MRDKFYRRRIKLGLQLGIVVLLIAILLLILNLVYKTATPQGLSIVLAQAPSTSVFGVELFPVDSTGGLTEIQATQTSFTRGAQVIWKDIEALQGQYDWSKLDQTVLDIQNLQSIPGAEPIVVVRGTPDWAQNYPPYSCGPMDVNYFIDFGNFMQALIAELENNRGIVVKYWEIWNEPDIARQDVSGPDNSWGCWGEIGDQYYGGGYYGEMLKVVYPMIKAANSNAVVLIGGLFLDCDPDNPPIDPNTPTGYKDCSSGKFLEGIIKADAGNAFDGVAFHAFDYYSELSISPTETIGIYRNDNWPASGWDREGPIVISKSRFIKSILNKYNLTNKVLISTENSLLDCDNCTITNPFPPLLEETKAGYIAQVYTASIAEGSLANIWFDVTGSWLRNNGLVKVGSPSDKLPAYYAYQFAASYLVGAQLVYKINEIEGVSGYEFRMDAIDALDHIWVLWSKDGNAHAINFITPPNAVKDIFGNDITVPGSNSYVVSMMPTYFATNASIIRSVFPVMDNNYQTVFLLGDFETGLDGWTLINNGLTASRITSRPSNPPVDSDQYIPNGIASIILGDPALTCQNVQMNAYAAIERLVSVPDIQGKPVRLSFDYIVYTEDEHSDPIYDRFEVYINAIKEFDEQFFGTPGCGLWKRIPSPQFPSRNGQISGWANGIIDVSSYRGQTILISFRNYNRFDNFYNTYSFVDNIQLLIGQ